MKQLKAFAAKYIADYFSEQKGFLLKVGQYLGNKSDASDEFKELTHTSAHPIPFSEIEPALTEAYGDYHSVFKTIDPNGIAASLSQVHRGILKSGDKVAIKIKHTNVDTEIEKWLSRLALIPALGPIKKWQIEFNEFINEFRFAFKRELNFTREVTLISDMKRRLEKFNYFKIPDVYPAHCTKDIIVMSWEDGDDLLKIAQSPNATAKNKLSGLMIELFLRQILQTQLFQTDFNPGNFLFDEERLIILDAGSFLELPERYSAALYKILNETNLNEDLCLELFAVLDFDKSKLTHIKRDLPALCKIIAEPFRYDHPYNIVNWKLKEKIAELLGENKWWFRSAGSPQFFHVLRSFALFANYLESLNCEVNFKSILAKIQTDLNTDHFDQILALNNLAPITSPIEQYVAQICVTMPDGRPVAEVKFTITDIKELIELIPDSVRNELADLEEQERLIIQKFNVKKELPLEIFSHHGKERTVKIVILPTRQ